MGTFRKWPLVKAAAILLLGFSLAVPHSANAENLVLPEGTTVYLETSKTVIGKPKYTHIGDIVPARVWRDVIVDGQIVIKGGTQATAKVAALKKRKIFGRKGFMALEAIETRSVDGQTVHLSGGYNKEGKGRKGVALGVGLLVAWPVLFVKGKAAELPSGTVMDSYTMSELTVSTGPGAAPARKVDLSSVMSGFEVEVLYELLADEKKPKFFDFRITADRDAPSEYVIDVVNTDQIDPIKLKTLSTEINEETDEKTVRANVKIKKLAKKFKKGINTFEVSYDDGGERISEEVILDIEM